MHVGIKIRCLNQLGEPPVELGSEGGNRTPTNGFGDRRTAIILPLRGFNGKTPIARIMSPLRGFNDQTPIELE